MELKTKKGKRDFKNPKGYKKVSCLIPLELDKRMKQALNNLQYFQGGFLAMAIEKAVIASEAPSTVYIGPMEGK